MADKQLQIKVKVKLPSGELENEIKKQLNGLNHININGTAHIENAKLSKTSLASIKRQLRDALKIDGKNNNKVHVEVVGEEKIAELKKNLQSIHELANKAIKINVAADAHNFDKQIEAAAKKSNSSNGSSRSQKSQALSDLSGVKQLAREQRRLESNWNKIQNDIAAERNKMIGEANRSMEDQYKRNISRYKAQQEQIESSLRTNLGRQGLNPQLIDNHFDSLRKARSLKDIELNVKLNTSKAQAGLKKLAADAKAELEQFKSLQGQIEKNQIEANKAVNQYGARSKYARQLQDENDKLVRQRDLIYTNSRARKEDLNDIISRSRTRVALSEAREADRATKARATSSHGFDDNITAFTVLQTGFYAVAGAIGKVNEIDKAITKVTKVVPDSQKAIDNWTKTIYKSAAKAGVSTPDYANAVEKWATAGYNLKQSNYLAKRSVMGSFVGEVPVEDMVNYMSVPLNSFRRQHLKADDVINAMNQVSNKHAVEMNDLGLGYSKAAPVMAQNGTTFAQLTGMITAGQEATRAGGDVVGRAVKVIGENFSKMSSKVTATDKRRSDFFDKELGVKLTDAHGKMKSTYEIMDQLAGKWKGLTKQQKQDAALYAAGKEHSAVFSGMLDNWKTARTATAEAEGQKGLGKNGSAYQEMEKQKQSIAFQLNALEVNWEQFLNNLTGGRKGMAEMLSLVNGFMKVGNALVSNQGIMSAARWTAMAGGIMVTRRAMGGLLQKFGEYIGYGKKGDSLFERLTGLGETKDKIKASRQAFRNTLATERKVWGGKKKSPEIELKKGSDGLEYAGGVITGGDINGALARETRNKQKTNIKSNSGSRGYTQEAKEASKGLIMLASTEKKGVEITNEGTRAYGKLGTKLSEVAKTSGVAGKAAGSALKVGSRIGSLGRIAGSALGVVGSFMGGIGIAMDAMTIAGIALNAMGIHPMQAISKALHPARTAANEFTQELNKMSAAADKNNEAIENNAIVNGDLKSSFNGVKDITDSLKGLNDSSKLDNDTFQNIKKNFNDIAKSNGLELRIRSNDNVGDINNRLKMLQERLQGIKQEDASNLADKTASNISKVDQALNSKNLKKFLDGNSSFSKELNKITNPSVAKGLWDQLRGRKNPYGNMSENDLRESYLHGSRQSKLWNSNAGRQLDANVRKLQKGVRSAIAGAGDALSSGVYSKADLESMNLRQQSLFGLGAIQNLRNLKGQSGSSQAVKNAKNQLAEVLSAMGITGKSATNISNDSFKGDNGNLLRDLLRGGFDTGQISSMAGIGAKYWVQKGGDKKGGDKKVIEAAAKDEGALQKWQSNHKNANNLKGMYTENGFLDYDRIAKFNYGKVNYGSGRKLFNSLGVKYSNNGKGPMSLTQAANLTNGLSGNALQMVQDFATGQSSATTAAVISKNAAGKNATGKQIVSGMVGSFAQGTKKRSKASVLSGIDQAHADGQLTDAQAEAAIARVNKNYNSKMQAKTVAGLMDEVQKGKHLTSNQVKNMTKGLSKKERQQALQKLDKNGNLSKGTKNALQDDKSWYGKKVSRRRGPDTSGNGEIVAHAAGGRKATTALNKALKQKGKLSASDLKKLEKGLNSQDKNAIEKALLNKGKLNKSAQKYAGLTGSNSNSKNNPFSKMMNSAMKNVPKELSKIGNSSFAKGLTKQFKSGGMFGVAGMAGKGLASMLFGKNNKTLNGLMNGFSKKGIIGGSINAAKMGLNGLGKSLFGKGFKLPNLGNMFKGFKFPNLSKQFSKSLKLPNIAKDFSKAFKGFKFPNLSKMFGGKNNPFSKLFGGKGKSNKIKVDADTKGLESQLKKVGKNGKAKVKIDADTKSLKSKIQSAVKGVKAKVKVTADVSKVKSSITRSTKGAKAKVKVTADTSGLKSKIQSATKGAKAKVKVEADTSGLKSKIQSAANGIKVRVSVVASGTGKVNALKTAISGIQNKSVKVSASVSGTGKVNALKTAINGVHSKRVTVTATTKGLSEVRALQSAIDSVHGKSVTVSVTKSITTVTHSKKGKSIAVGGPSSDGAMTSASVASGVTTGATVTAPTGGSGSMTSYSTASDDQTVNEDYWRYMDKQLYTGLPLDERVSKLENAVTQADDNMDKLIDLAKQRIDVDKQQINYQKSMQSSYQQEVTDMINKLHAFGFKSSGNKITNLGHAKDIKGDNASKVDEYLGKYQTAYQNLSEATKTINELQTDIWQQGKNQEDYRNTKDQKMVEKLQRSLEILNTAIENHKSIMERQAESLTDQDYIMKNKNSSDQINTKANDVYDLLQKFNELSVANFVGTKDDDSAKNLLESLQSIRDSVMENLDSIEELKKSMHDNEISSVVENLSRYTENLNNNIDKLKNNVENLQDGLLSGTTYSDLVSSNFEAVDLSQRSAYERNVDDRVALEKQLDSALDAFAKKNVDRTAQVANKELQITYEKYESLVKMAESYASGEMIKTEPIRVQYEAKGSTDNLEIPGLTHNKEWYDASVEYQKKMNNLKAEYNKEMAQANTSEQKQAINQQMLYKQLDLQEEVNKAMIVSDQKAIDSLRKLLNSDGLTTEQRHTISDQIAEYENNQVEAQNNIKDAVKQRFEYEKTLMDQQIDRYQKLSDTLDNMVTIASALHLDGNTQARIIGNKFDTDSQLYDYYREQLHKVRWQMEGYQEGSFEYNQLKEIAKEYESNVESLVNTLFDETKDMFTNTLDENLKSVQRSTYGGKTMDDAKFDQTIWYTPSQKELRLEEMRLKITELEDKTIDKKITALDQQERLSKAEAEYVDKQLDVAVAQQKLNNTLNKRDVRYLEKGADGKFHNVYTADQEQVDQARKDLNTAKQELEDAKTTNLNSFNSQYEEIISAMKDGTINPEEAKRRIGDLAKSFEFILKDVKGFNPNNLQDAIKAYDDYLAKNKNILNNYGDNSATAYTNSYKELIKGFGDQFKAVSKDLGAIFGKELRAALNLNANGNSTLRGSGTSNSITIQHMNVDLPNVKDVDEFSKAINTLPQMAQQYASNKF